MPRFIGTVRSEKRTSLGPLHMAEALADALVCMIENLPEAPTQQRVALRNHLAALMRAYPELEARNQLEAERVLAEEDGVSPTYDP